MPIVMISLIVLQLAVFGVLIFVFRRLLNQNVSQATRHIDEMAHDYHDKEREINKRFEEAQSEAKEIIIKAQQDAQALSSEIASKTASERDSMLTQARAQAEEIVKQADRARNVLLSEMEERINRAAQKKACEILESALSEEFKRSIHTQWVHDLLETGLSQFERLHIPSETNEVKISTPFALTDSERQNFSRKIKEYFNRELSVKEEIDPKLIAGITIQISSLVLDGSFRNKIQEKSRA